MLDPTEVVAIGKAEAEKEAEYAFRLVIEHGPKIELDHHLVYHTRESSPALPSSDHAMTGNVCRL